MKAKKLADIQICISVPLSKADSDWQSLVIQEKFPKAIAQSFAVLCLTGNNDTIKHLQHSGVGISYDDA